MVLNQFNITLAVCLGSVSCWKVKLCPRFSWIGSIYISINPYQFSSPCSWKAFHTMMLPLPCFTNFIDTFSELLGHFSGQQDPGIDQTYFLSHMSGSQELWQQCRKFFWMQKPLLHTPMMDLHIVWIWCIAQLSKNLSSQPDNNYIQYTKGICACHVSALQHCG